MRDIASPENRAARVSLLGVCMSNEEDPAREDGSDNPSRRHISSGLMLGLPERFTDISFQRVPHGSGVGYAIIAGGKWLGTLSGAEAEEFRSQMAEMSSCCQEKFLLGVVLGMCAMLTREA